MHKRAVHPGLDAEFVAGQMGHSVRYLHRLLESTGRTFAEHLLDHRLDCAVAMLRDSDSAHLKIGELASRAGFSDISHFNRSFRRRFGDTPHGVRVRAARQQAWSRADLAVLQLKGRRTTMRRPWFNRFPTCYGQACRRPS